MSGFKQTMLTQEAYNQLKEAKELIEKITGRRSSFTEVIRSTVGKQLVMTKLDVDIKNYISAFVDEVIMNRHTLGIVLFGSVANGTFSEYSDIDLAVFTDSEIVDYLEYLNKEIRNLDSYQDKIIRKGYSLYINPLIISKQDVQKLNPIYFEIGDNGILLYERYNTVSNFLESLRKFRHKRLNTKAGEILTWL